MASLRRLHSLPGHGYQKGRPKRTRVPFTKGFYDQTPSADFIQALEDCDLFYISFEEFQHAYRTHLEFNVIGRALTNKYLKLWHQQARNIRMLTAEERYAFLLDHQPELIPRVPIKDLASYLDMSKETLSRMRARLH